jgi:putative peptidoglycan lipid II flippase
MSAKSNPIRLISSFFTVGMWTLGSRVMGFVREIMFAYFFGSSATAEAFQIAFALPNMFRRFFAEGAFNMAFVPMFAKKLENGEEAKDFAQNAMANLATILIILTTIALIAMPWFVLATASGFAGDERFDLATDFGRIAFPYILFISLAALLSGVLNALGRFAAAAAAPVFLNIILVAAMALAYYAGYDVGKALTWGVPVAGIAQLTIVWVAAKRAGLKLLPQIPRLTPDMKKLAMIALPAMLAGGVVQINLVVGRQVASHFDGAIQWLAVADRLYQLPLGVVGIAIGVVLLPDLSRKLSAGDADGGRNAFNRATEFALALTLPATVGLLLVPGPVVSVLFERGAFNANDSAMTASALAIYAIGLPAFVLQKVFQPLYFAREDTKTPFRLALVSMVINAALAFGLREQFGFLAAAIGTTVSSLALVILLYIGTRKLGPEAQFDAGLKRSAPRLLAASLIMAAATYGLGILLEPFFTQTGVRYLALFALIVVAVSVYFAACLALGAFTKQSLRSIVNR